MCFLTVDTAREYIYFSKGSHPEEVCHHRMKVNKLQIWPDYDINLITEDHNSFVAKVTFCVTGIHSKNTDRPSYKNWAKAGTSNAALIPSDTPPEFLESHMTCGKYEDKGEETWVIRCITTEQAHEVIDSIVHCGLVGRPRADKHHPAEGHSEAKANEASKSAHGHSKAAAPTASK